MSQLTLTDTNLKILAIHTTGWLRYCTAVAKSLNVPAVSVLNSIGLEIVSVLPIPLAFTCNQEELGLSMALGGLSEGFSPYKSLPLMQS